MKPTALLLLCILLFSSSLFASSDSTTIKVKSEMLNRFSETMEDYFSYQSNVVEMRRSYQRSNKTPDLYLNGGNYYAHDYIVNGLSFRNPFNGLMMATLSPSLFGSMQLYDSYIPLQYGNMTSGAFVFDSPDINERIQGSVESVTDNVIGDAYDQNFYRGMFSGSLLKMHNLKFQAGFERRWLGDRAPSSYTDDILPGSPNILPNNASSGWTYSGKIVFDMTTQTSLSSTIDGSTDEWQDYRHYLNNPEYTSQIEHTPRYSEGTYGINTILKHEFSERTTAQISFGYFKSEYKNGDGVVFDDYENYHRFYTSGDLISNPAYDVHNLFIEGDIIEGVFYEPYYDDYLHSISSYKLLSASVVSQLDEHQKLQVGISKKDYTIRYFRNLNPTLRHWAFQINRYGFDEFGNVSDDESWKNAANTPTEISGYLEDVVTYDIIKFTIGFRLDRFDYKTKRFINESRLFDPYNYYGDDIDDPVQDSLGSVLDESDLIDTKPKSQLSKRAAFEISPYEQMKLTLQYADNYQLLPFSSIYVGWDFLEQRINAGSYFPFPSTTLKLLHSRTYSFGIKYIGENSFNIGFNYLHSSYDKDISIFHVSPSFPYTYATYRNNFETTYESYNVYFKHPLQAGGYIFADATISSTEGIDYSGPYIGWSPQGSPPEEVTLDYERKLKLVAGISFHLPIESNCSILGRYESGKPYTSTTVYDEITSAPTYAIPTSPINSSTTSKTVLIDLKIEKEFKISSFTIKPFILVKNLLDEEVITDVYTGTGSPTSTGYLETAEGEQRANNPNTGAEFLSRYDLLQRNPMNFYAPRRIFIGVSSSF